ncbi:MAG: hypothetical protein APR63_05050 [Desulfuromonas sp. SDB]|nr:MAG: hypothetical protein APR63_05050 [Desulfuromonas sp. SDB]
MLSIIYNYPLLIPITTKEDFIMENDLSDFISLAKNGKIAWEKNPLKLIYLHSVDSTNNFASNLSEVHPDQKQNYLIMADSQFKGKGQKENSWFSPPEVGLYFSLLINPDIPARDILTIPETWGEMVKKTIESIPGISAEIKKPNDVLISGKKVAGILLESKIQGEICRTIIAGVGINVNTPYHQFPPELKPLATSIQIETNRIFSRSEFMIRFFNLNKDFNIL